MPTKAEIAELAKTKRAREDAAFHDILTALTQTGGAPAGIAARTLDTVADFLSGEADALGEQKPKGWVTAARDLQQMAVKLRTIGTAIEGYGARTPSWSAWPVDLSPEQIGAMADITTKLAGLPDGVMTLDGTLAPIAPLQPGEPAYDGHYAAGLPTAYQKDVADRVLNDLTAQLGRAAATNATATTLPPITFTNPFRDPMPVAPSEPQDLGDLLGFEPYPVPAIVVPEAVVNPFVTPKAGGQLVKRLAFGEVIDRLTELGDHDGSSFSQVKAIRSCGMQHAIGRLTRHGLADPARPGWALVGGTAFHTAVMRYEDLFITEGGSDSGNSIEQLWTDAFAETIEETRAAAGPYDDIQTWYASARGKEGYDWWRVAGQDMVELYAKTHGTDEWQSTWTLLAQEWEYRLDVGGFESHGFIDQVWQHTGTGLLRIDDLKSGSRAVKDPLQLAEYAYAVIIGKAIPYNQVGTVAYYDARKGDWTTFEDITARVTFAELSYHHAAARAHKGAIPMANVTDMCGGCSVKDLCPAQR